MHSGKTSSTMAVGGKIKGKVARVNLVSLFLRKSFGSLAAYLGLMSISNSLSLKKKIKGNIEDLV